MTAERLAELAAALGERDDLLELPGHDTEVLREQARSLPLHGAAEDRRSAALRPDTVAFVDRGFLQADLAHGRTVQPQLVEVVSADQPRRVALDYERADAEVAVRGLGRGVDQEAVGDRTVGHVALGAGEQVAVAVANCPAT